MANKYQKSLAARLAGGVAAVGMAACCMAAPAFAVDNTSTTDVTVRTDPSQTQITWQAPTEIAFAAAADGTLTGPSADATQIKNLSVFPIHVTKVAAEQVSPFNLVSDVTAGTETNAIQFSLKTGTTNVDAFAGANTATNADYDMGYAGIADGSDVISVEANSGKIARTTVDMTQKQKAATVTWTVAAGDAAHATA